MNEFERFKTTLKDLHKSESEHKIETLCQEIEKLKGKYDKAIIVLTGELREINLPSDKKVFRSELSTHIREAAATLKYKELKNLGYNPVIIPSGGKVYGKESNIPPLSRIMESELITSYGIEKENILVEPYSIDTSQNAKFSSQILKALGFSNDKESDVFLITNKFHIQRAGMLLNKYYKGSFAPIDSEEILLNFIQKISADTDKKPYEKVINKYKSSSYYKDLLKKDRRILAITKIPLGEKIIEAIAYYSRATKNKEVPILNKKK